MACCTPNHKRPAVSRTSSTAASSGLLTPQTPCEVQSPITDPATPAQERPGCSRAVTTDTLHEETGKFFDAIEGKPTKANTIAFAFDIDGVLVKGTKPVPGARETIELLQKNKIPFIFLTNGGGLTEKDHTAKLGLRLGLKLDHRQFVQSHTPFYDLLPKYKDKTVLVLGGHGNKIRDLAHAYGFQKVVTSSDLMAEWEHIHPFPELTKAHHAEHGRRLEQPLNVEIAAILIWSSPRDWCLDLQVIIDLLLSSGGNFGKKSVRNGTIHLPNNGYLQHDQPKLYFCNPDFEWATQHDHPRFAQGAFREALRGIWAYATNNKAELQYTVIGKPTKHTYAYGEKTLSAYNDILNEEIGCSRRITKVFMIGDNPESDIRGANSFESQMGAEWQSVLVESGVYEHNTKPAHTPTFIAENVKHAVEKVLEKEGIELGAAVMDIVVQNHADSSFEIPAELNSNVP